MSHENLSNRFVVDARPFRLENKKPGDYVVIRYIVGSRKYTKTVDRSIIMTHDKTTGVCICISIARAYRVIVATAAAM